MCRKCCDPHRDYGYFCGWCCCSLRTGFIVYYALTAAAGIGLLFNSAFNTAFGGYWAIPGWILAVYAIAFSFVGLLSVGYDKKILPWAYIMFKVLVVTAVAYDIVMVVFYIWALADIDVYLDMFDQNVNNVDRNEVQVWLGVGLGLYILGSIARYIFFWFLFGSYRSLQAVYNADGNGTEHKSAAEMQHKVPATSNEV